MAALHDEIDEFPQLDESAETLTNLRKQITNQCIGVIISSGDSLFRDGLIALVDQWEEFCLIGAVDSPKKAEPLCIEAEYSVCIIDTTINPQSLELIRSISEKAPLTKIIVLSTSGSDDDVIEALRAGIHGYCIRENIASDRIRGMIWGIVSGAVMIYGLQRSKLDHSTGSRIPSPKDAAFQSLSRREMEVITLLARGLSNAEIGARLYLSEATIKKNISRIVSKLQVDNRIQAAILASKYIDLD